ncbi:MAG: LicD family protein [Candidatus Azobacteroides sp.]|nr:LicD family protein [Candidatus Azobacteroides sp.]
MNAFFSQYKISPEEQKVFDVLLDILKKFLEICKDYDLKYYAYAGTLLGAVRHKGFIPWDDDIDIIMPRKDYNKFCLIAPKVLSDPYHFQSSYTDYGYVGPQIKVRNSNTSCIVRDTSKLFRYNNFNQGIFVSIFPLDGTTGMDEANKQHKRVKIYRRLLYSYFGSPFNRGINNPKIYILKLISSLVFIFIKPQDIWKKMDSICSKYDADETNYVCSLASYHYKPQKTMWIKELYNETIELDFEDIKIVAPAGYHEVLKMMYGDYMKPPKSITDIHKHSFILDAEKSYKYYMEHPEFINKIIEQNNDKS